MEGSRAVAVKWGGAGSGVSKAMPLTARRRGDTVAVRLRARNAVLIVPEPGVVCEVRLWLCGVRTIRRRDGFAA